jgi:hypothetical protein
MVKRRNIWALFTSYETSTTKCMATTPLNIRYKILTVKRFFRRQYRIAIDRLKKFGNFLENIGDYIFRNKWIKKYFK